MNYQYHVTLADGSTITVVAGSPISAAEAAKRAKAATNKQVLLAVPLHERKR